MMARFYFRFRQADTVIDIERKEYPGFKAAYVEVMEFLLASLAEALADGAYVTDEHLDICEENGEVLMTIPLADVLYMID